MISSVWPLKPVVHGGFTYWLKFSFATQSVRNSVRWTTSQSSQWGHITIKTYRRALAPSNLKEVRSLSCLTWCAQKPCLPSLIVHGHCNSSLSLFFVIVSPLMIISNCIAKFRESWSHILGKGLNVLQSTVSTVVLLCLFTCLCWGTQITQRVSTTLLAS